MLTRNKQGVDFFFDRVCVYYNGVVGGISGRVFYIKVIRIESARIESSGFLSGLHNFFDRSGC
jgi:hypothetical protein